MRIERVFSFGEYHLGYGTGELFPINFPLQ